MYSIIKKIKITKKQRKYIILAFIFFLMLFLNLLTPLIADDYSYSIGLDKSRINGFNDIFNYQIFHYTSWGGRTVAHTIAQIFLLFPKCLFSILNSLCFVGVILLMYNLAKKESEEKPHLLLIIFFLLYFLLPVFGQNTLWLIGSCNYLWTTLFILLLVFQYKKEKNQKDSIGKIIGIFLLGIIAGWTNENTAFGLIVVIIAFLFKNKIEKKEIQKWKISGLAGAVLGFLALILAPGNYARKSIIEDNSFFLKKIFNRFMICTDGLVHYFLPIIIIFLVLITIYIYKKKKININAYIYFIGGGILSIYPMVLSPTFPARTWFGPFVFGIIGIIVLVSELDIIFNRMYKYIFINTFIVVGIVFVLDYYYLAKSIYNLRKVWDYRTMYIEKYKDNEVIKLPIYYPDNVKNPNYGLDDISKDVNGWPNQDISYYYGINGIQSYE